MRERAEGHRIAGGARWRFVSVANQARIVAKDLRDARSRRAVASGPSVAERRAELVTFYERFEQFVETLCEAAQYGPTPRLNASFAADRAWVVEEYARLGHYLGAFLNPEEPDSFERLTGSESLAAFLAGDDGGMIFRITSTRDALSRYAEHLRQLAARKAE